MLDAEKVNYWQTSRSGPTVWLDRAAKEIAKVGGTVLGHGFVSEPTGAAFMMQFEIGDDYFRIIWPVLKPKGGNMTAARIQAATALYHEIKSAAVKAKFLGARIAFFAFLVIADPDGRVLAITEFADDEIYDALGIPRMLQSPYA